jgi:gamma-glutamylputrescine oxidase
VDRRKFLKTSLYSLGGVAAATAGSAVVTPLVYRETMCFDPNTSFWALAHAQETPPLAENIRVDMAIIGGGLTGLFAAYHFAERFPQLKIVLLEARQVGHGASGTNGGMILPQTPNESFEVSDDEYTHKHVYEITARAIKEIQALVTAEGDGCDLILNGFLHTAREEEDIDYYEEYVGKANRLGLPLEFLTGKETAHEIGSSVYYASVFDPNGGQVHPIKLVHLLKRAVLKKGVTIFENSPVFAIEEGKTVLLTAGEKGCQVKADSIILATDAYTSKLGYFKNGIIPIHSQCAITKPISASKLSQVGWKSRLPYFDSWNKLFHLILTPDNRICIGGGNAEYFFNNGLHYRGDLNGVAALLARELARIYPAFADVGFESVWNGILGMTSDGEPSVGVAGRYQNIYYALAYNGQGLAMTYLFGKIMADVFEGKKGLWENTPFLCHPIPFVPPEPLRWIGAKFVLSYYGYLDRE